MYTAKRFNHGDYGEWLVKEELKKKGWAHLGPIKNGMPYDGMDAHHFDHFFYRGKDAFLADSKAKAKRNKGDTGIDISKYTLYLHWANEKKLPFICFFIDEHPSEQRIYWVSLRFAERNPQLTRRENGKIFFKQSLWHHLRYLTADEVARLRQLDNRHHDYETTNKQDVLELEAMYVLSKRIRDVA